MYCINASIGIIIIIIVCRTLLYTSVLNMADRGGGGATSTSVYPSIYKYINIYLYTYIIYIYIYSHPCLI